MQRFLAVQERKGRKPTLLPRPGVETRWDSDMDEAERANIIMGDVHDTVAELYSHGGEDYDKLTLEERASNDTSRFLFSDQEKKCLRHFEGGGKGARDFSKFLQDRRFSFSYVLFEARFTAANASQDFFGIVADISHSHATVNLRKRGDCTILVKKSGSTIEDYITSQYVSVETMDPSVAKFRRLYAEDLTHRLRLDALALPHPYSIPALLNPLFGLRKRVVDSGLMSSSQYIRARRYLVSLMQTILDRKSPANRVVDAMDDSDEPDSEDDELPEQINTNHDRAVLELEHFESYKMMKYHPEVANSNARVLKGDQRDIIVGPVLECGRDLPSGKNLADYVDCDCGRIDLVKLFEDHSKYWPTLWLVVQMYAHCRVVEVGCERFFSMSGYTSNPRRARLDVRSYERIAMLSHILRNIYIDDKLVAEEYSRRAKSGAWKKENMEEALKCWNLERILEAETFGQHVPADLTMQEFGEGTE